jgi:hypothetical protein
MEIKRVLRQLQHVTALTISLLMVAPSYAPANGQQGSTDQNSRDQSGALF